MLELGILLSYGRKETDAIWEQWTVLCTLYLNIRVGNQTFCLVTAVKGDLSFFVLPRRVDHIMADNPGLEALGAAALFVQRT